MIDNHPNASVAGGTGLISILAILLLEKTGVELPAPIAAAVPVVLISATLFVGRRGLKGIARLLWKGDPEL